MRSLHRLVFAVFTLLSIGSSPLILAQQQVQLPHQKKGLRDTGRYPYIVTFGRLDGSVPDTNVADCATDAEATDLARQLDRQLSESQRYTYMYSSTIRKDPGAAPAPSDPALPTPGKPSGPQTGPKDPLPRMPGKGNPNPFPRLLVGSTFNGTESLAGYGKLRFTFGPNGRVTMRDADGDVQGRWEESGQFVKQVTLTFYDGTVRYDGTLIGDSFEGTATNGKNKWTWKLSLEQPPNPAKARGGAQADPAPNTDTLNLTGTRWEINGMSFGLRGVDFRERMNVTGWFNVEASRYSGSWSQTGPDQIQGDFGRFGTFTARISGDRMTVTRPGGTVVLFRK